MTKDMTVEQILQLVENPHYQLSTKQLALLEKYRASKQVQDVRHSRKVPNNNKPINKHDIGIKEEGQQ